MKDIKKLNDFLKEYNWLKDIAKDYEKIIKIIEKEKNHFVINGFVYSARGPIENFIIGNRTLNINPHYTIPYTYVLEGVKAALNEINKRLIEIEQNL